VTSQLFPSKKKPLHKNEWNPVEYFWVKIDEYSPHRNPKRAAKFPFPLFQTLCKAWNLGNLIASPPILVDGIGF